jgi:hypothetical protein
MNKNVKILYIYTLHYLIYYDIEYDYRQYNCVYVSDFNFTSRDSNLGPLSLHCCLIPLSYDASLSEFYFLSYFENLVVLLTCVAN